jgi:hypothetical protein
MKSTVFILLLSLFSSVSFSQKRIYTQKYLDTVTFSSLLKIKSKGEILKETLDSDASLVGYTKYYTYLSYLQQLKRNEDSIKYYVNKAIEVYEKEEGGKELGERFIYKAYYIKGVREYFDGKIITSANTLYRALKLSKKHKEVGFEDWRFYIMGRLVTIHSKKLGDYKLAIKFQKEIIKDSVHMSYAYDGGNAYSRLASLYAYNKNIDSAKIYDLKAVNRFENGKIATGHRSEISFFDSKSKAYSNLAQSYRELGEIDSTIYYIKIKQKILEKIRGEKLFYEGYNTIYYDRDVAFLLLQEKRPQKAIDILRLSLDSLSTGDYNDRSFKEIKVDIYDLLIEANEQIGSYKKALEIAQEKKEYEN